MVFPDESAQAVSQAGQARRGEAGGERHRRAFRRCLPVLAMAWMTTSCGFPGAVAADRTPLPELTNFPAATIGLPPTWTPVPSNPPAPARDTPGAPTPALPAVSPSATSLPPVFHPGELPGAFVPLSFGALGLSPEIFSRGIGTAQAASAYIDEVDGTVLVTVAAELTPQDMKAFDRLLGTPQDLLALITLGLGGRATAAAHPVSGFPTYGDWTAAVTMPVTIQNKPWRMDLAVLRMNTAAGYALLLIPAGVTPEIRLENAVEQLLPRLAALASTPVVP
jgi:hypothetical protein